MTTTEQQREDMRNGIIEYTDFVDLLESLKSITDEIATCTTPYRVNGLLYEARVLMLLHTDEHGDSTKTPCPNCNGQGWQVSTEGAYPESQPIQVTCSVCNGTGIINSDTDAHGDES